MVIFVGNASSHMKVIKIVKVSGGYKHTTFLDEKGIVYSCGSNETG
jgi:alpha-tubulin suppressor-like RCC1 family protein